MFVAQILFSSCLVQRKEEIYCPENIFILMVRQSLLCFSGRLCWRRIHRVKASCGLAAASIILSFRKHFSVVILATWAHCGLMSASECSIFILSNSHIFTVDLALSAVCVFLHLCRSVGMFCHIRGLIDHIGGVCKDKSQERRMKGFTCGT